MVAAACVTSCVQALLGNPRSTSTPWWPQLFTNVYPNLSSKAAHPPSAVCLVYESRKLVVVTGVSEERVSQKDCKKNGSFRIFTTMNMRKCCSFGKSISEVSSAQIDVFGCCLHLVRHSPFCELHELHATTWCRMVIVMVCPAV